MADNSWDLSVRYDIGEINNLNKRLFSARYNRDEPVHTTLRNTFLQRYQYDIMDGTGPYLAVVLKVLSGPQTRGKAKTGDNWLTTGISHMHNTPAEEFDELTGKFERVRVIARIPSFDADIKFPEGADDDYRISCHAEFVAMSKEKSFETISPGALVYVAYANTQKTTGFDGRPSGKMIAVHQAGHFAYVTPKKRTESTYKPKCKASGKLAGPGGGMYVGETISNPNKPSGPGISKIKGKIKTGFYGNGTAQTKAHFDEALLKALDSVKYKIPGPAPGSDNAFVWIGSLKNNGYLDLLDRPITSGRETIIYAPMTLDLDSPIEIKYYFHDVAGFGHSWLQGPATTVEEAKQNWSFHENDFRHKIAPGIKDLIRQGRNFVLVIPEMAHSRGYGTSPVDSTRVEALSTGKTSGVGDKGGSTLRTYFNPNMKPQIKEYLRSLPIEKNQNLLHITPLLERPYCTFDGSFSGGRFDLFHQEVIEVLSEHLGKVDDKVGFISILADGMGATSLASIVKKIPNSSVHYEAEKAFKNVKIDRIDYVVRGDLDTSANNLYFPSTPSYSIYSDYLIDESYTGRYLEFNYIAEATDKKVNEFFNKLGINTKFQKANKASPSPGKFKFSHSVGGSASITMHISPKDTSTQKNKVGYAFSMMNSSLPGMKVIPKKAEKSSQVPTYDAVPDHAMAIAASPAASDLARYQKQEEDLKDRIEHFEELLGEMIPDMDEDEDGPDFVCSDPKWKVYCSSGALVVSEKTKFFADYLNYLEYKKGYMQVKMLLDIEGKLLPISNNKEALLVVHEELDQQLDLIKDPLTAGDKEAMETAKERWKKLKTSFKRDNFQSSFLGGNAFDADPGQGAIASLAEWVGRRETLHILTSKIKNAIKRAKPRDRRLPADCASTSPVSIGTLVAPKTIPTTADTPSVINCKDTKIAVPSNYKQLAKLIPYYPKKIDFFPAGPGARTSTKKTNLELSTPGYEAKTFKYKATGIGGATLYHESPPIWSCLADKIQTDWELACNASGYTPFKMTSGIKGSFKQKGITAYNHGMSLHAFGLAFDLDPYITGYSEDGEPLYSVYTGAWTPGLMGQHGEELYDLGVIKRADGVGIITTSFWDDFLDNAYEGTNRLRLAENWSGANDAYKSWPWNKPYHQKYDKIMTAAKGAPIVPYGANPTLWLLLFCEKTGMKWGNSTFLKKRYRGGSTWSLEEQNRIAAIYGIPDVVPRIYNVSWAGTRFDDHMHFQYYNSARNPGGVITWKEMEKVQKNLGK